MKKNKVKKHANKCKTKVEHADSHEAYTKYVKAKFMLAIPDCAYVLVLMNVSSRMAGHFLSIFMIHVTFLH